ncbi:MAG TPA: class I SAM-dependent methyltransferase [Candidatus Wallbacteria bacterium]|nr:class I SAM-dependent methyltransferase [Candidatus Wallbacteria bacterium]
MDKKFLASSRKKIRAFFAGEFKKFGYSYESLNWESQVSQYTRFEVLSNIGEFEGEKILDVGCGLGDFLKYLKLKKIKAAYAGIDICDEMIDGAKEYFKKNPDAKFMTGDILEVKNASKYDYVVSSGAFNMNLGANDKMIKAVLKKMHDMAGKAAAVSMLSTYETFTNSLYYYYDPLEIFTFCKSICEKVVLRHDYMPHDFTIIMYKG